MKLKKKKKNAERKQACESPACEVNEGRRKQLCSQKRRVGYIQEL